jgi:hypothetical protein
MGEFSKYETAISGAAVSLTGNRHMPPHRPVGFLSAATSVDAVTNSGHDF